MRTCWTIAERFRRPLLGGHPPALRPRGGRLHRRSCSIHRRGDPAGGDPGPAGHAGVGRKAARSARGPARGAQLSPRSEAAAAWRRAPRSRPPFRSSPAMWTAKEPRRRDAAARVAQLPISISAERRVRGTLHELKLFESPPHTNPLPASGERELIEIAAPSVHLL